VQPVTGKGSSQRYIEPDLKGRVRADYGNNQSATRRKTTHSIKWFEEMQSVQERKTFKRIRQSPAARNHDQYLQGLPKTSYLVHIFW